MTATVRVQPRLWRIYRRMELSDLTRDEEEEKALDLILPILGKARSIDLLAELWNFEAIPDVRTLRAQLARIRRDHCIVSDRQLSETTAAVATPVRIGTTGPVHAALGIVVTARGIAAARTLRDPLMRAAQGISAELGRRAGAD